MVLMQPIFSNQTGICLSIIGNAGPSPVWTDDRTARRSAVHTYNMETDHSARPERSFGSGTSSRREGGVQHDY